MVRQMCWSRNITETNYLLEQGDSSTETQHSAESSFENLIPNVETPINVFRNLD